MAAAAVVAGGWWRGEGGAIRSGFLGRLSYDIFIFLGVCTGWADLECGKWDYLVYSTWRLRV